jgi:hypothetical protein
MVRVVAHSVELRKWTNFLPPAAGAAPAPAPASGAAAAGAAAPPAAFSASGM